MLIPFIRPGLLLAFSLCSIPLVADVEFQRIWPTYRTAESFTTITEYFGAPPRGANQMALRTQPDTRDGFYWLARIKANRAYAGAFIRLEVTRQGNTEPRLHEFDWDVPSGSKAVFVGLTGNDWSDSVEAPIAWRLTVIAADGTILATDRSFLWNHPTS